MNGLLTLDEAMNADDLSFPSLNPQRLELGIMKQKRVHRFYQSLLYNGQTLCLQTPAVYMSSLKFGFIRSYTSIRITNSPWLSQQFNILNDFVRETAIVPDDLQPNFYNPLPRGRELNLCLDKSCRIMQDTKDDIIELPPETQLGSGKYTFVIKIKHVYFCYIYFLTYCISHIYFKADSLP